MPSLKDMRGQAKEAGLMKLDKLIAARQHIPDCPIPIPIPELCQRYEKLYTGCINDVLREYTLLNQNLPSDIMPLRDEMTLCGEAFTVKSAPNVMIEGEMTFRAQMLDDFKPNGVVVWDTSEDTEASLWGGVMTATAMTKGIRGAVIAGGIRDTKQILEQKFPIFYKYRTSNGSLGRCMITHYQVPVRIGKVTVRPGDIIFGDIDGVLCIPREIAYQVLLRAEGIEKNEVDIFSWVRQGDTISEIIDKGGYF
ncbi:MAG: RraA family protein [Oligosphaeraceae bacterium]